MATGGVQGKDQADKLTCAICLDRYRRPKLLPCFHSYCQNCLLALVGTSLSFPCPACRAIVVLPSEGVSALQNNFYIERDQDDDDTPPVRLCDVCTADREATHSCLQCQQRYCVPCQQFHNSITACRGHTVVPLQAHKQEDGDLKGNRGFSRAQDEVCPKHQNQPIVLYCLSCKSNICIQCKLTSHEGHSTEDLVDTGKKAKTKLQKRLKTLTEQTSTLAGILSAISDKRCRLGVFRESSEKDIRDRADKIRHLVDECQEKTLASLQDLNTDLLHGLSVTEDSLQNKLSALTAQSDHITRVLREDKETDIVNFDAQLNEVCFDSAETSQILSHLQGESEPYSCKHNPLAINTAQLLEFIGVLKKSKNTNAFSSDSVPSHIATESPSGHGIPVDLVIGPAEKPVNIKKFVYSRNTRSVPVAMCSTSEQRVWIKYKPSGEGEMMALFGREGLLKTLNDVLSGTSFVTVLNDITVSFDVWKRLRWMKVNGQIGEQAMTFSITSTPKTCEKVLYARCLTGPHTGYCRYSLTSLDSTHWGISVICRDTHLGPIKDVSRNETHLAALDQNCEIAKIFITTQSGQLRIVSSYSNSKSQQRILDACFFPVDGQEMLLVVMEWDNYIHVVDHTDGCNFVRYLNTGRLTLCGPRYLATDHQKVLWIACDGGSLVKLEI